jgi:hypothetical protein
MWDADCVTMKHDTLGGGFETSVVGSTGHWPVPSGNLPDGRAATIAISITLTFVARAMPADESPTGTGESLVPPTRNYA